MLQYKVIDKPTLDLLIKINNCDLFLNYRLVEGTAFALIHGYRKSIDLDFFGNENIDTLFLNNIKVDIVNYPNHKL